jgi:hypothetical protein
MDALSTLARVSAKERSDVEENGVPVAREPASLVLSESAVTGGPAGEGQPLERARQGR